MSDDLTNVPRRLRRYYRHGEPIPSEEMLEKKTPTIQGSGNVEENEPWMNAKPASSSTNFSNAQNPSDSRSKRNERRENARNNPAQPASEPKPGLFSQILNKTKQPSVTPMDHALGLHEKKMFDEKPPQSSNQALRQSPPASTSPLPKSAQAQNEIQNALQELRALAKNEPASANNPSSPEKKSPVPLTSFHFTPAGEAPHSPQDEKQTLENTNTHSTLSPRERAEQRRAGRGNEPSSSPPNPSSTPTERQTNTLSSSPNAPAHIRRRMGQVESGGNASAMGEESSDNNPRTSASSSMDEDFKSLFGDSKAKNKDTKKKKEKEEDDDLSLDDGEDGLELFDDEK